MAVSLRCALTKAIDFLDAAGGEGLAIQLDDTSEMDAASIMVELAEATGVSLEQLSETMVPQMVEAILAAGPTTQPSQPRCGKCHGTGFIDFAHLGLDPCDHATPAAPHQGEN